MTEFEKWWESKTLFTGQPLPEHIRVVEKAAAARIWQVAQLAAIRTINDPPCIPFPGDRVRLESLNRVPGRECTITKVEKGTLDVVWLETSYEENGETLTSSGLLGEITILVPGPPHHPEKEPAHL